MPIYYFTEDLADPFCPTASTTAWLKHVIAQEGYTLTQLNIIFCSDAYLQAKNKHYLQHDTWTDILTFDYAEVPQTIEGELYISLERVYDNAQTYQFPIEQERHTVLVHGLLHLMGYQDHTPLTQAHMRQKEATYLAVLAGIELAEKSKKII